MFSGRSAKNSFSSLFFSSVSLCLCGSKNFPTPKPLSWYLGVSVIPPLFSAIIRLMNALLKDVLARLDKLSPERQNELAVLLLSEMEADERWDVLFAKSQDEIEAMADEALDEHARGKTRPLDSSVLGNEE